MNWKDISEEIEVSSLKAVESLFSRYDREHIYALALFTSDDGASISMAANTEEGYQAHLAAEAEDEPNSPEDEIYYRWAPAEWVVEGWDRAAFSRVNALLAQQEKSDFDSYFDNLIEAMITALATVKETLGERLADVTAFVTVTDSGAAEGIENASASRINAADLAGRFLLRFG
ncbi:DUF4303 domain-containing protein [Bradyrhizobium sp. PRIMUS42]|uniref:DUF4303 domain-containing protein n=1 Tax=Bradyrhizobium sp. PRIMUS42 TaxID=2908926 RepID=UPI001FF6B06D|nr:DUF4303 domain-containing protein [Bradyrhizobium sp. PRIMUS42]MCJ9730081.1 DUF4303 domain-containing protein [Bradyrhizobium sp. PRIMUS42]